MWTFKHITQTERCLVSCLRKQLNLAQNEYTTQHANHLFLDFKFVQVCLLDIIKSFEWFKFDVSCQAFTSWRFKTFQNDFIYFSENCWQIQSAMCICTLFSKQIYAVKRKCSCDTAPCNRGFCSSCHKDMFSYFF